MGQGFTPGDAVQHIGLLVGITLPGGHAGYCLGKGLLQAGTGKFQGKAFGNPFFTCPHRVQQCRVVQAQGSNIGIHGLGQWRCMDIVLQCYPVVVDWRGKCHLAKILACVAVNLKGRQKRHVKIARGKTE